MNSWLYLTADDFAQPDQTPVDTASVYFWHDDTAAHRTSLSEAATALKGREVKLIVPMEMCSWQLTEPWLGKRRPSVQALAFAVEEQLVDELEELHIAVGPVDSQQRYPLLITHKQRFKSLLVLLHECGLNIVSAQADADVLPHDQACAAWWDERWILGGSLEARLALSAQGLATLKPELPHTLIELDVAAQALPNAVFSAPQRLTIDLLQGEFQRKSQVLPWRTACAALLLMFALALGFTHVRSGFLEGEATRVYALSEQRFKTLYPDQTRIVDLSAQLKMLQQQGAAPHNGYMARLSQLTEQVIGASSAEVQRMELRAGVGWTLNITARNFAELQQLRERGIQSALPITLGNASQQGSRVQALLTLEEVL